MKCFIFHILGTMAIYMWRPIPVSWVTLDKSSIGLATAWQTVQLTATVSPNDAADKTVVWSSSNTSIATVSNTWLVTCVTPWNCTITVTTNDWGFTATCSVNSSLVYDFTTQDVLTFTFKQNGYTWYGWSSWNWYYSYIQNSSYYRTNTTWQLPDTAFGWTLQKIRITMNVPNNYSGGWITSNSSTNTNYYWYWLWCWDSNTTNQMTKYWPIYSSYTYSSWIQTLVIDVVNNEMYVEWNSSTPVSLSSQQALNIRTYWANKTFYLNVVANKPNSSGIYTYLRGIEVFKS